MNTPHLVAAISNVSMGFGHDGLKLVAKKFGFNTDKLEDHQLILFINTKRDKLKLLGAKGTILGYIKMPGSRSLPAGAVQFIPQTFAGKGHIDVDAAIHKYLETKLAKRGNPRSPLEVARRLNS